MKIFTKNTSPYDICVYEGTHQMCCAMSKLLGSVVYWKHVLRYCCGDRIATIQLHIKYFSHKRE